MKSFEQISNFDIGGFRRNGIKNNVNMTEPSQPTNNDFAERGPNMGQVQTLYVKEFFGSFFEKKCMLEAITQISSAIHVLQTLIKNFQNQKGIISDSKMLFQHKLSLNGTFSKIIERESGQISQTIEDIYQRLENIFYQWNSQQKQTCPSLQPFQGSESNRDEQLYQMLNDYKADNKKQKQLRKKAQTEYMQLKKQINRIQEQKIKLSHEHKENQFKGSLLKKKITELEQKIGQLHAEIDIHIAQKDEMSEKLGLLCQINGNLASVQQQNQQLKTKLKQAENRESILAKKFEALQGVVIKKIEQKEDKWIQMIESRLTSKTLFQKGSCLAFQKFMGTMQKMNKC